MKKEIKVVAIVLVALIVFLAGFGLGATKGININGKIEVVGGANTGAPAADANATADAVAAAVAKDRILKGETFADAHDPIVTIYNADTEEQVAEYNDYIARLNAQRQQQGNNN